MQKVSSDSQDTKNRLRWILPTRLHITINIFD